MAVLIHFDTSGVLRTLSDRGSAQNAHGSGSPNALDWYCQWASERVASLFVLVPEELKDRSEQVVSHIRDASPLWYTDSTPLRLPDTERKEQIWLLNGDHLPLIDWHEAANLARRQNTDVTVFGPPESAQLAHYLDTVAVDETD